MEANWYERFLNFEFLNLSFSRGFTIVVMFRDKGAAIDPMTCPTMVNANDGGFMLTATYRNPAPKVPIPPAAINYTK